MLGHRLKCVRCFQVGLTQVDFRIADSPVGTTNFMSDFVEKKLAESVGKLQAIKSLGSKQEEANHTY